MFLLLRLGHCAFLLGGWFAEFSQLLIILSVKILVILRNVYVYFATRLDISRSNVGRFVISFCPPSDIMGVTEGVNIKYVDVSRCKQDILNKLVKIYQNQIPTSWICRLYLHR
jgi:hypothetical protein